MKSLYFILIGIILLGCSRKSDNEYGAWRKKFIKQESYRIVETSIYFEYDGNKYSKQTESTSFKTFDSRDKLIGENDTHFYEYDSKGRLVKESFCMRTCEVPYQTIYIYSDREQLIETRSFYPNKKDTIADKRFEYNLKGQLVREIIGPGEKPTTIEYTYNSDSTKSSLTRTEFNTNVNSWLTYYENYFYDPSKKLVRKEYRMKNKDLVKISLYKYGHGLEIERTDTTITSIPSYKLDLSQNVSHHAYYGKEEFKYDKAGQIIEHIIYRPDYKTPNSKWTFEYKKLPPI